MELTKEATQNNFTSDKVIHINPPPRDQKCQRCGKHISELQPFGGVGDLLVGDFTGAKLVKTFRSMDENEKISDEDYQKYENINAFLVEIGETKGWEEAEIRANEKFGKEDTQSAMFFDQLSSTVSASWECRDCIIQ